MALTGSKNEEKGNLQMDPIIETSRQSKVYSAPVEENVSLVSKFVEMPRITSSRSFAAQTTRVG